MYFGMKILFIKIFIFHTRKITGVPTLWSRRKVLMLVNYNCSFFIQEEQIIENFNNWSCWLFPGVRYLFLILAAELFLIFFWWWSMQYIDLQLLLLGLLLVLQWLKLMFGVQFLVSLRFNWLLKHFWNPTFRFWWFDVHR